MTATVIPIRPDPQECLNEVKLWQDVLHQLEREVAQDVGILEDTKRRYLEANNSLRTAIHRLHVSLGID